MASVVYGRVLINSSMRVDEMAGHFAHGACGLAAFVLGLGNGLVDARLGAPPRGAAGDNAGDLIGKRANSSRSVCNRFRDCRRQRKLPCGIRDGVRRPSRQRYSPLSTRCSWLLSMQ